MAVISYQIIQRRPKHFAFVAGQLVSAYIQYHNCSGLTDQDNECTKNQIKNKMAAIFLIENLNVRHFFFNKLQPKHSNFVTWEVSVYIQNYKRFGLAVLEITRSQRLKNYNGRHFCETGETQRNADYFAVKQLGRVERVI